MHFIEGPPNFAVEVRVENDYGLTADAEPAVPDWRIAVAGVFAV